MKILVVEDSRASRAGIKLALADGNFSIVEASSGQEALIALAQEQFDLVTMDIGLPDISGLEICQLVRSGDPRAGVRNQSTPIIFLTGSDDLSCRTRGFDAGAADFLGKNLAPGQLLMAVERILNSRKRLAGLHALIIDDSPTILMSLRQALQQEGMGVTTASQVQDALEILAGDPDFFDLVITDHNMPGLTGLDFCRLARTSLGLRDLPIIVVTGNTGADVEMGLAFFKAGATDYITKPYIKDVLLARVCGHMESRVLLGRLNRHMAHLDKLNKLKDQFLGICSHDLQAPLGSILGFSKLFVSDPELPPQFIEGMSVISNAAQHLSNLVHNLLDLGKIEAVDDSREFERLVLGEKIEETALLVGLQAMTKGISITLSVEKHCAVRGNPLSVARIITNLASNAIKFTRSGGTISISCSRVRNGRICMQVQDSGVGMDEAQVASLFQPYSKSSTKGTSGEKGTGLGMTITQSLVKAMGGELSVSSKAGVGTLVSVEFPEAAYD